MKTLKKWLRKWESCSRKLMKVCGFQKVRMTYCRVHSVVRSMEGVLEGLGGGVKVKEAFGSTSKHSGMISADQLAIITKEITKKVQKDCEEKMNQMVNLNQMMNLKLEGMYNHLKEIGVPFPDGNFVNDIGTPHTLRSSCQSVGRQDHLSNLKDPTPCHLWVVDQDKGRVVVARGTVFLANNQSDNMVHNNLITSDNIRVSIDDVGPEYQLTRLPVHCDELETVGSAVGSFVQWPKDFVTLGQDPPLESTPEKGTRLPKIVESKGSATLVTPPLADDANLSEHCQSLHFLVKKRIYGKKDVVFKFEESGEQVIYVGPDDIDQFLIMASLSNAVLEFFAKYVGTLCRELNENRFAFMLPSRLAILDKHDYERRGEACDYLAKTLITNKERHFILAPYVQDNHWMLLLFSLKESVVYIFDSLKKERDLRLKTPM